MLLSGTAEHRTGPCSLQNQSRFNETLALLSLFTYSQVSAAKILLQKHFHSRTTRPNPRPPAPPLASSTQSHTQGQRQQQKGSKSLTLLRNSGCRSPRQERGWVVKRRGCSRGEGRDTTVTSDTTARPDQRAACFSPHARPFASLFS